MYAYRHICTHIFLFMLVDYAWVYAFVKIHRYLTWVHLILCKLYLNKFDFKNVATRQQQKRTEPKALGNN